jgi:hypothetical protein
MIVIRKRFSDVRIYETEISPTLEADMGTGGGKNQPIVLEVHDEAEDKTVRQRRTENAMPDSLRIPVP